MALPDPEATSTAGPVLYAMVFPAPLVVPPIVLSDAAAMATPRRCPDGHQQR